MNDKDLVEFFIYLRDYCYNRDFQIAPEKVVECFREYQFERLHKPVVMQGLPTENEIRAQALLVENPNDSYATKIIASAAYESGARWAISKLSRSPTVASEGLGEANMCAGNGCNRDDCWADLDGDLHCNHGK